MPDTCAEIRAVWQRARRVCIVMLSAIGDAVHVLPVVNALKRDRPEVEITWVIQPGPHLLVRDHPAVDRFVLFHRRRGMDLTGELVRTARSLREERYDLVIGLQVYLKAGLLFGASGAPVRLGFDRARARDLQWLFATHRIPPHPQQHVQDQYLEFVHCMGVASDPVTWKLDLNPSEREAQVRFFGAFKKPVCAVVVGTSKPQKNWLPERYARLLEMLEDDFGFATILVGGPSTVERELARSVLGLTRADTRDELGDDLRRLVFLLEGSGLVISPDTGPLHIARALETPVVGLYGYTNPRRTGPYRRFEDLVVDGYARFQGEPYPVSMEYRRGGMARISVAMVAEKVQRAVRTHIGSL